MALLLISLAIIPNLKIFKTEITGFTVKKDDEEVIIKEGKGLYIVQLKLAENCNIEEIFGKEQDRHYYLQHYINKEKTITPLPVKIAENTYEIILQGESGIIVNPYKEDIDCDYVEILKITKKYSFIDKKTEETQEFFTPLK